MAHWGSCTNLTTPERCGVAKPCPEEVESDEPVCGSDGNVYRYRNKKLCAYGALYKNKNLSSFTANIHHSSHSSKLIVKCVSIDYHLYLFFIFILFLYVTLHLLLWLLAHCENAKKGPSVIWRGIRVAKEWWGCHWNVAKPPSFAMPFAKVDANLFVGQTTNSTETSVRCVIRIVGKCGFIFFISILFSHHFHFLPHSHDNLWAMVKTRKVVIISVLKKKDNSHSLNFFIDVWSSFYFLWARLIFS